MNNKNTFLSVILGLAACASSSMFSGSASAQEAVKIGAFVRNAGSDDYAAKAFEQGLQLAVEKRTSPPIKLQLMDESQSAASQDGSPLKALVETDHAPALIYWKMDDIVPVGQYLTQSEVLGLVAWEVTKKVPYLGNHIFGFGYSTELSYKEFAKYAGKNLRANRIGIISTSATTFDTQAKAFSEESKSLGNTVVFDEKVDPANADFSGLIARAAKEKCDTVFAALPGASLVAFVKAARAKSYKGNLLAGDTLFAAEISTLGKDAEGVYMVQSWSDDAAFKSLYSTRYGTTPDNVTLGAAALGYDVINCIQDAGIPLDSSTIKYSFLSKPCEGLTGITQFSGERIAKRKKRVVTVKNGEFALAE